MATIVLRREQEVDQVQADNDLALALYSASAVCRLHGRPARIRRQMVDRLFSLKLCGPTVEVQTSTVGGMHIYEAYEAQQVTFNFSTTWTGTEADAAQVFGLQIGPFMGTEWTLVGANSTGGLHGPGVPAYHYELGPDGGLGGLTFGAFQADGTVQFGISGVLRTTAEGPGAFTSVFGGIVISREGRCPGDGPLRSRRRRTADRPPTPIRAR